VRHQDEIRPIERGGYGASSPEPWRFCPTDVGDVRALPGGEREEVYDVELCCV
jgi:hypothetical protein